MGFAADAGVLGGATTWQSDIDLYMSTRAAQGFNSVIISCFPANDITGLTVSGATWDGVAPWTGGVKGSFNSSWWQRVDYVVSSAEANGITVWLSNTNYWSLSRSGGMINGITTGQATTYGAGLAARYAASPNIVWFFGNDYTAGSYDSILDSVLARCGRTGTRIWSHSSR